MFESKRSGGFLGVHFNSKLLLFCHSPPYKSRARERRGRQNMYIECGPLWFEWQLIKSRYTPDTARRKATILLIIDLCFIHSYRNPNNMWKPIRNTTSKMIAAVSLEIRNYVFYSKELPGYGLSDVLAQFDQKQARTPTKLNTFCFETRWHVIMCQCMLWNYMLLRKHWNVDVKTMKHVAHQ